VSGIKYLAKDTPYYRSKNVPGFTNKSLFKEFSGTFELRFLVFNQTLIENFRADPDLIFPGRL
jgi:hypothetical protein